MADTNQASGTANPQSAEPPKSEGLAIKVTDDAKQASTSAQQVAQDATKQASLAAQDATKQASQVAQDATKQASQAAQDATKQASKVAEQATQQARQAVGAGLQQGVDNLKKIDVKSLLSAKEGQPKVTSEEKLWAIVSYVPMVSLLALVIKSDSNYIKLHGRQGLLIFLIFFLCIFVYIIPWIGPPLGALIQFLLFVLGIFSMYQAFIGNWWKIPVLGDLAEQIPANFFTKIKEAATGLPADQAAAPQSTDQNTDKSGQNPTT